MLLRWTSCVDLMWEIRELPMLIVNSRDDPLVAHLMLDIPRKYIGEKDMCVCVCGGGGGGGGNVCMLGFSNVCLLYAYKHMHTHTHAHTHTQNTTPMLCSWYPDMVVTWGSSREA